MIFEQNMITALMSAKFDGCVQIEGATYTPDSTEAALTAIFLDGVYQNVAISANSKEGWVKRCVLKPGILQSTILLRGKDVEWNDEAGEPEYETVCGKVQILCCSPAILRLIQDLVRKAEGQWQKLEQ